MRKLFWDESFRRAFKRRTRNDPNPEGGEDAIVLVDLGSHEEVY